MAKKVYPEWVQQHKTKGTAIKKVGTKYYLYKHTSKRVPGKKYPQPVDFHSGESQPLCPVGDGEIWRRGTDCLGSEPVQYQQ